MNLLELFSGIGGFSLGLHQAGFTFDKVYFSEIDRHAIANFKHNFPNAQHVGSVCDITRASIERPDIITFGSPCQNFSAAGNGLGLQGAESSLIRYAIEAIDYFRPDIFIWENVKGVLFERHCRDFWAIVKAFADIGLYQIEWQLLNTAWVLPQNRERIYLVGRLAEKCRDKVFPVQESNEKEICSENRNENVVVDLSSENTIKGKDISTTDTNFPTIEQETSLVQQGQLFVMESVNKKQPIAWLRLKNKNDNDFKPAFNDKEVSTLISKGYKIAKRFSKEEKSYIISQGYEVS